MSRLCEIHGNTYFPTVIPFKNMPLIVLKILVIESHQFYKFHISSWSFLVHGSSQWLLTSRNSWHKILQRTQIERSASMSGLRSGCQRLICLRGFRLLLFPLRCWLCYTPESCALCGSSVMPLTSSYVNKRYVEQRNPPFGQSGRDDNLFHICPVDEGQFAKAIGQSTAIPRHTNTISPPQR